MGFAVPNCSRHQEQGHNVVDHEFAHKLDMLDGAADGTPPLRDRDKTSELGNRLLARIPAPHECTTGRVVRLW